MDFLNQNENQNSLKSKELNCDIMTSIKNVRQKLASDISSKQNNQIQSKFSQEYNSKGKPNFIQRTVNVLKNKISELQRDKLNLQNQLKQANENHNIEIENLKGQLVKFIQKQIQGSINQDGYSNNEIKLQSIQIKEKLKKRELENNILKSNFKTIEENYRRLQKKFESKCNQIIQLQKQKQKHIELNIIDKMKFQEEVNNIINQNQKKSNLVKKLQQENISLKRQIHNIFNKERMQKQKNIVQKKNQEDYQFQLKELTQKFTIKIKNQQKQLNLLRKTIQKLKQKHTESDINALNQYQIELEEKKEKIIQKDKKINLKNIEIQKLSATIQNQANILQEKDLYIKSLIQDLNHKQQIEKQLTNQIVKNGLSINQIKQSSRSLKKEPKQIIFDISFDKEEEKQSGKTKLFTKTQIIGTGDQQKKQPIINEIAVEQRSLASLKSNYKKINNKQMSLNEIMMQIRRKTEKINDLRSLKSHETK